MRYEIRHLKDHAENLLLIVCDHPPSVSEGWNAVFHALPEEPWGIYNARDTAWEPGSLAKVAQQFWPLVESKEADVGLVGYSNLDPWPAEMAKFNVFMLTRDLVNRCVSKCCASKGVMQAPAPADGSPGQGKLPGRPVRGLQAEGASAGSVHVALVWIAPCMPDVVCNGLNPCTLHAWCGFCVPAALATLMRRYIRRFVKTTTLS